MNRALKAFLVPGVITASLVGTAMLSAQPASADLLRDVAVGAATNVVTGEILNNGSVAGNAAGGVTSGAAVSATHNRSNGRAASIVQDAAVGAVTNVVTGEVLNNGSTVDNAIGGATTGVVINVTRGR